MLNPRSNDVRNFLIGGEIAVDPADSEKDFPDFDKGEAVPFDLDVDGFTEMAELIVTLVLGPKGLDDESCMAEPETSDFEYRRRASMEDPERDQRVGGSSIASGRISRK